MVAQCLRDPGVPVGWDYWSSYKIALFLSFFQLFPSSTTRFTSFCPLVENKYLHLTLSAAWRLLWRAVMTGPFLWAYHNLSNSVRPCGFPLGWISIWTCHSTSISSGSSPFFSCSSFIQELFWTGVFDNPIPPLMPCLSTGSRINKFSLSTLIYPNKNTQTNSLDKKTSSIFLLPPRSTLVLDTRINLTRMQLPIFICVGFRSHLVFNIHWCCPYLANVLAVMSVSLYGWSQGNMAQEWEEWW